MTTVQAYQPHHLFIKGSISVGPFQVSYLKINVAFFVKFTQMGPYWSIAKVYISLS